MNKQTLISITVIAAIIIGGLVALQSASNKSANKSGKYDALASCIGESGATFYGAFWCPHCNNQKKIFGKSEKLLPYVECSTPDGKGQNEVCINLGIQTYPTWIFADGSILTGEQLLETLAKKTGCEDVLTTSEMVEGEININAQSEAVN